MSIKKIIASQIETGRKKNQEAQYPPTLRNRETSKTKNSTSTPIMLSLNPFIRLWKDQTILL